MSIPIAICRLSAAARGVGLGNSTPERVFDSLVNDMAINKQSGAFTVFPCNCDPRCPRPTNEQLAALSSRLEQAVLEHLRAKSGRKAQAGS